MRMWLTMQDASETGFEKEVRWIRGRLRLDRNVLGEFGSSAGCSAEWRNVLVVRVIVMVSSGSSNYHFSFESHISEIEHLHIFCHYNWYKLLWQELLTLERASLAHYHVPIYRHLGGSTVHMLTYKTWCSLYSKTLLHMLLKTQEFSF